MKAIKLPVPHRLPLPYYLAAEEWAATCLEPDPDGYFFAWQVHPTVICGRHQVMPLEVDLDYASARGIDVWRRKSGGGCVYADDHNVMFSLITSRADVGGGFAHYTSRICSMLHALGMEGEPTGRNDIAIRGRKVAGNAFYRMPRASIVHGTMLYDADPDTMSRVLTPARAKLLSNGVQSVPARITTLRREGMTLSCDEFMERATALICDVPAITVDAEQDRRIREIMLTYTDPSFLRRNERPSLPLTRTERIERVGSVTVGLKLDARGCIERLELSGDFFAEGDSADRAAEALRGVRADRQSVAARLDDIFGTRMPVAGLDTARLVELITNTSNI